MAAATAQRVDLGLLDWPGREGTTLDAIGESIRATSGQRLEYIVVLGDYPPTSPRPSEEMLKVDALGDLPFDIYFATANCMGYGLYDSSIYPWSLFRQQLPFRSAKPRMLATTAKTSPRPSEAK